MNITHRDELLVDIARGLRAMIAESNRSSVPLECIEVQLWVGEDCRLACDVPTAIDYLGNDVYWDERFDWSDADRATVRFI